MTLTQPARGKPIGKKPTDEHFDLLLPSSGLPPGLLIGQTQLEVKGKGDTFLQGQPPWAERKVGHEIVGLRSKWKIPSIMMLLFS